MFAVYGFMWVYDSYALANSMGRAVTQEGGKTWFFLPVDYAWGEALSGDLTPAIAAEGGKVIGSVKTPLNTSDFSSFLLQAQASKADVVALERRRRYHKLHKAGERIRLDCRCGQRLATGLFFQ